ncbi:PREDICTED: nardilysin-like [Cyphomyrmex costatus]|uniref:nardilysin-like n=1 Tax=Cyphomyrmex costatus TaxID=456900 RepID=UPI0008521E69|nr:PREDICTED: nardilysin-like [Cyphomyrmex costatus]
MVSRGSEKYEDENDFIEFISKHSGCNNSVTDYEHTTFYFALGGIQKKQLSSALDRFTHFFIKPLMKKDVIKRMTEIVKEDLQLSSSSYDTPRRNRLLSSFAPIGHPVNKFPLLYAMTMNYDNDESIDKLYDALHTFRERHYSAHRMKLVIQATLSLDTLEKYVKRFFIDIPSNWLPPDDFTKFTSNDYLNINNFRKIYKIKPFKNICHLQITWVMPSLLHLYKSKPHNYILWIIKHEGKGSLISYLLKKRWAFGFVHDNPDDDFEHNSIYTLFNFTINLTQEGLQHVSKILDVIFSFINLLKSKGPQKRIYDEIYKITENKFRLLGNNDYVDCLCKNMHLYPPRDYITGKQNYFEYDPEAIQNCLYYLMPETVNIMIFDKNLSESDHDQIPENWIERWRSIEPLPDFHLPFLNESLTSNDDALFKITRNYPIKLIENRLLEIWYLQKIGPKCYINFQFIAYPLGFQSPKTAALMKMYCNVFKQLLQTELFPAIMSDIHYDITVSEKGIIIKMNGFNEKLLKFLSIVATYMTKYSTVVKKNLFESVKVKQLEICYNKFTKPEKLIKNVKLCILKETIHYTHIDTYIALRDINFEEFQKFVKSFTDCLYIQCFVRGSILRDTVINAVKQYVKEINCSPLVLSATSQTEITQIPLGTSYCKLKNIDKTDVNSVITNYYQVGIKSIELSALLDVIINIMLDILDDDSFFQEQFDDGDICVRRDDNEILGFSITVYTDETHKHTSKYMDQLIGEFLKKIIKVLGEFSHDDFNITKKSLIKEEREQLTDIMFPENEVDRNWNEIMKQQYMFDKFEKKIVAINNIKLDELRKWFALNVLNESNFRKLSLHVVGTDPKEVKTTTDSNKIQDFVLEYIIDDQQETKSNYITNIEQ